MAASGCGSVFGLNQDGSGGDKIPVITPVFKTPMSDGPFKDEIVVEILAMDGKIYS